MKAPSPRLDLACLTLLSGLLLGSALIAAEDPIDWNRAQQLHQKALSGGKLTPEESTYYERAKAARAKGQPPQGRPAAPAPWTQHLTPLPELGTAKYKGEDGGLYGGGKNEPPVAHAAAAKQAASQIQPLDAEGKPAKDGKIGVLSVGMSNTTMEYSRFKQLADADPAKSARVVIVDGAQGGRTATVWAKPDSGTWEEADNRLRRAGVSPQQVQVVWLKQAEAGPGYLGDFPKHAQVLKEHNVTILNLLKQRFPNLRIAYLSSRIYAGYATTGLNPEPYSYEGAFAVRWIIQDQIAGKPELNHDPAKGAVNSPLVLWGPYLWGDGMTPRKSDGVVWEKGDLTDNDGTHPSQTGREKVAKQLLTFFKNDPTARGWFTRGAAATK
jgi:hypothetical protein